jgi:hypothetical protein
MPLFAAHDQPYAHTFRSFLANGWEGIHIGYWPEENKIKPYTSISYNLLCFGVAVGSGQERPSKALSDAKKCQNSSRKMSTYKKPIRDLLLIFGLSQKQPGSEQVTSAAVKHLISAG